MAQSAEIKFHEGQHDAWQSKARTVCIVAGRRWGKSEFGVWWTATKARKYQAARKPGIGWYIIPTYKVGRPTWRKYQQLLPKGWATAFHGTERAPDAIDFGPHVRIEIKTAEKPENLVAEGLAFVWIDEAGVVDEAVWRESIRPALIDHRAPALLTGTPKGKNWFHRMCARGRDPAYPTIETFGGPTFENPWLDPREFQELTADMPPHLIRQEIFGEFLEDSGDVFRNVEAARQEASRLFPRAGGYCDHPTFCIGVDLAMRQDFTVLYGVCYEGHPTGFQRWRGRPWPDQIRDIAEVARETQALMCVDASGLGDVVVQQLEREVERIHPVQTGANKGKLVDALSIALDRLRILLPDEAVIVDELQNYEYGITPHGNITYSAPEGMHDDCVIAVALTAYGLLNAPPPVRLWGISAG